MLWARWLAYTLSRPASARGTGWQLLLLADKTFMNDTDTSQGRFGVRVSLPENDPFNNLLDEGWNEVHWFATQTERDMAMLEMSREHEYSRKGDKPSLVFEAIERKS